MKTKYNGLVGIFLVFAALIMGLIGLMNNPVNAAPPAAPTPLNDHLIPAVQARAFNFQQATALTADTNTTGIDVLNLGAVDIQYVIDQTLVASTPNTTTLTVQYSNDNTNWTSGVALATDNTADGNDLTRVPVFGRWMRIRQDVSNSNPITITLLAVGR